MFGKGPRLDPLESRKDLLIAESELNRVQLSHEWERMSCEAGELAQWVKTIGAWVSSAALLVTGFAAFRRSPPAPSAAKLSWFKKILNGARVASSIWLALRNRGHRPERP